MGLKMEFENGVRPLCWPTCFLSTSKVYYLQLNENFCCSGDINFTQRNSIKNKLEMINKETHFLSFFRGVSLQAILTLFLVNSMVFKSTHNVNSVISIETVPVPKYIEKCLEIGFFFSQYFDIYGKLGPGAAFHDKICCSFPQNAHTLHALKNFAFIRILCCLLHSSDLDLVETAKISGPEDVPKS